jgi:hypothetical protein
MAGLNQISAGMASLAAGGVYFVSSFLKVNLGTSYPSDCLLSLGPIAIIFAAYFTLLSMASGLDNVCSACENDSFCYWGQEGSTAQTLITFSNFDFMHLNGVTNLALFAVSFSVFSILCWPIDLWKELSFYAPCFTALSMAQITLLCPNSQNNYSSVIYPARTKEERVQTTEGWATLSIILFCFLAALVSHFVGKRTGAVLSFILLSVFFCVAAYWVYFVLVSTRLAIV